MRIPVLFSFWLKFLNLDGIFVIWFWTSFLNKLYSHQKRLTLSPSIVFIKKEKKNKNYVCWRATPSLLFSFFLSFLVIFYFPLHLSFISNKKKLPGYTYFFCRKKERKQRQEKWKCKLFIDFRGKDVFSGGRLTLLEGKSLEKKWQKENEEKKKAGKGGIVR